MVDLFDDLSEMSKPVVVMAIGAPGSGKSTWMRPMAEKLSMVYVCPDDVRAWLLGDVADQRVNPRIWQVVHLAVEIALSMGKSVAVDALHHQVQYRIAEAAEYRRYGAKSVVAVNFYPPLEKCLERNASRQRKVDTSAIRQIYAQLLAQPVRQNEGFDKIFSINN
jgi:predicted kinase